MNPLNIPALRIDPNPWRMYFDVPSNCRSNSRFRWSLRLASPGLMLVRGPNLASAVVDVAEALGQSHEQVYTIVELKAIPVDRRRTRQAEQPGIVAISL